MPVHENGVLGATQNKREYVDDEPLKLHSPFRDNSLIEIALAADESAFDHLTPPAQAPLAFRRP